MSIAELVVFILGAIGVFMICIYFISLISQLHNWALNKWMNLEPERVLLISFWMILLFSLFFSSAVFYKLYLIYHGQ
jgi:small-conductance mechanosensitive channel